MIISARTDRGNVREGNEDSLFARGGLLIVADGMGGHKGGEVASSMAVATMAEALGEAGAPSPSKIEAAFQKANGRIFERAQEDPELRGMGTTVTLCQVGKNVANLAHIGDSRAYLMRNGVLTCLTRDHSLVEELVRNGYITREQALVHPHRHVITRALGTEGRVKVDQRRVAVQKGDRLLLCTDGLMLHVPDDEIQAVLSRQGDVEEHVERLVALAMARGGEDNITVVLAVVEGGGAL
jgi:protein phosphatase